MHAHVKREICERKKFERRSRLFSCYSHAHKERGSIDRCFRHTMTSCHRSFSPVATLAKGNTHGNCRVENKWPTNDRWPKCARVFMITNDRKCKEWFSKMIYAFLQCNILFLRIWPTIVNIFSYKQNINHNFFFCFVSFGHICFKCKISKHKSHKSVNNDATEVFTISVPNFPFFLRKFCVTSPEDFIHLK